MADKDTDPATEMTGREDRASTREETGRRARIPLGVPQKRLDGEKRPGYVRRWINDKDGRVQRAEAAGYQFVEEKAGNGRATKMKRQVGALPDGSPMHAYLMEIKEEFYNEDQALKSQPLDEFEAAIRRGTPQGQEAGALAGHSYVPSEGTSVKHGG